MVQQIWTYDGEPHLIWNKRDSPEQYTVIPPEDGMYYPIRFDEETETWVGSDPTENQSDNEEEETDKHTPSVNNVMLAKAQMQITKTANQLIKSQKEQAKMAMDLMKKEKRLSDSEMNINNSMMKIAEKTKDIEYISKEQAKMMMELTKINKKE